MKNQTDDTQDVHAQFKDYCQLTALLWEWVKIFCHYDIANNVNQIQFLKHSYLFFYVNVFLVLDQQNNLLRCMNK